MDLYWKILLGGITRQNVLDLCKTHSIPVYEKNFTLSEVYEADEAFVTGTFAGIIPIYEIDDHDISLLGENSLVLNYKNIIMNLLRPKVRND